MHSVAIKTPDGAIDAKLFTLSGTGPWAAVIMLADIFGVRPVYETMAQRLVDDGFAVLLPNPYYRIGPAPVQVPAGVYADAHVREHLTAMRQTLTADRFEMDIGAMLDWLQGRPEISGKVGIVGYCMTGGCAIASAGQFPDRIGAAVSFHAVGLATDAADSPHLMAVRSRAPLLIGHATADPYIPVEMIERLHRALDTAGVTYEGETYPAAHGWCIPTSDGYDHVQAERAWDRMITLFRSSLT